jgi:hypothetical protein
LVEVKFEASLDSKNASSVGAVWNGQEAIDYQMQDFGLVGLYVD